MSRLLNLLVLVILCTSCNKYKIDAPGYIEIDKINLTTNYNLQGAASHNITDAWVFIDDVAIGAYELPAKFPVLTEGNLNIKVLAGIKVNGISTTRDKYPFYNFYEISTSLVKSSVTKINPTVQYFMDTVFYEDFEFGNSMTSSSNSDTTILLTAIDTNSELGSQSAAIYLDATHTYFDATTSEQFILPKGNIIYVELSYKSNNEFSLGIVKTTIGGVETLAPFLNINPSDTWKTIYIDITDIVKIQTDALLFDIYLSGSYDPSNTLGKVYFDNLKVVY